MSKTATAVISFFIGMGVIVVGLTLGVALIVNGISERKTFVIDKEWTVAVNEYRKQNNVEPVKEDYFLNTLAAAKCEDMVQKDYYSHYDPDNKRIDALAMKKYDFDMTKLGWAENIHEGAIYTSSRVVADWYASPSHKEAMLNPDYTRVGHAACYTGHNYKMVEVFTSEY